MIIEKSKKYELRGVCNDGLDQIVSAPDEESIQYYSIYQKQGKLWQCIIDIYEGKKVATKLFNALTKKYYFLFGKHCVDVYYNEEFETFIEQVESGEVYPNLASCNQGDDPQWILDEYDGWDGFVTISEDEYKAIKKLL